MRDTDTYLSVPLIEGRQAAEYVNTIITQDLHLTPVPLRYCFLKIRVWYRVVWQIRASKQR